MRHLQFVRRHCRYRRPSITVPTPDIDTLVDTLLIRILLDGLCLVRWCMIAAWSVSCLGGGFGRVIDPAPAVIVPSRWFLIRVIMEMPANTRSPNPLAALLHLFRPVAQ